MDLQTRLLVVDDDPGIRELVADFLTRIERRRALKWFAGAGPMAVVAGCSGGASSGSGPVAVVAGTSTTVTPTPTPTPTATTTTASSGSCIADPVETGGPFPADGTNTASGATSNVLTVSGIVRSDIRPSFIGSTTVAGGVKIVVTLTVVNVNAACAPLAGDARVAPPDDPGR